MTRQRSLVRRVDWPLVLMLAIALASVALVGFSASQLGDATESGTTVLWALLMVMNFGNAAFMGSLIGRHLAQR
jgi:hypothetical protein